MKIAMNQLISKKSNWLLGLIAFAFVSGTSLSWAANGEELFNTHCATCHKVLDNSTGPKMQGVRAKWEDGGAAEGSLYQWVRDWSVAAAKDPYAASVANWSPTAMSKFGFLSDDDITAIFDYADNYVAPSAAGAGAAGVAGASGPVEEEDNSWVWLLIGVVFVGIILAVGGVRRQLKYATLEEETGAVPAQETYGDEIRSWIVTNRKFVGIIGLVVVLSAATWGYLALNEVGVYHNYQPSQPIEFPHDIHAGVNGIDCKYCHNSVEKSKTAGIPSVNVCMNCHKGIKGNDDTQKAKIAKIYEAAGFNPEGPGAYTNETAPIVWNKVHVLPDHVYFNHKQHVVVGGIDCKQCHGDMTKEKTARVMPVEELSAIEGNVKLTRATLTMGWCIECHGEKEVSNGALNTVGSGYYDEIHKRLLKHGRSFYKNYMKDDKVTVKELGGWECAKCHY
jgi:mono/diheme cytochrome c family protein